MKRNLIKWIDQQIRVDIILSNVKIKEKVNRSYKVLFFVTFIKDINFLTFPKFIRT